MIQASCMSEETHERFLQLTNFSERMEIPLLKFLQTYSLLVLFTCSWIQRSPQQYCYHSVFNNVCLCACLCVPACVGAWCVHLRHSVWHAGLLRRVWGADDEAASDRAGLPVLPAHCHCALHAPTGVQRLQQVCLPSTIRVSASSFRTIKLSDRGGVTFPKWLSGGRGVVGWGRRSSGAEGESCELCMESHDLPLSPGVMFMHIYAVR